MARSAPAPRGRPRDRGVPGARRRRARRRWRRPPQALTDGMLAIRYPVRLHGATLVDGRARPAPRAPTPGRSRTFLDRLMPRPSRPDPRVPSWRAEGSSRLARRARAAIRRARAPARCLRVGGEVVRADRDQRLDQQLPRSKRTRAGRMRSRSRAAGSGAREPPSSASRQNASSSPSSRRSAGRTRARSTPSPRPGCRAARTGARADDRRHHRLAGLDRDRVEEGVGAELGEHRLDQVELAHRDAAARRSARRSQAVARALAQDRRSSGAMPSECGTAPARRRRRAGSRCASRGADRAGGRLGRHHLVAGGEDRDARRAQTGSSR